MPVILIGFAENPQEQQHLFDEGLKRFKRAVNQDGTVKMVKNAHFIGALTVRQRRRAKTQKATRRWRRLLSKMAEYSPDRYDQGDRLKSLLMASDLTKEGATVGDALYSDISWADPSNPETWNPDLTPVKIPAMAPTRQFGRPQDRNFSPAAFYGFGKDQILPPPPSVHVCVIAEYSFRQNGKRFGGIVAVRGTDLDETTKVLIPRDRFQFPGGGVEFDKNETCEQAATREYLEETGLIIAPLSEKDRIYTVQMGTHTFICYIARIVGGSPKKGTEIVEMRLPSLEQLKVWVEKMMLSPNHRDSFRKYLEIQPSAPAKKTSRAKVAKGGVSV